MSAHTLITLVSIAQYNKGLQLFLDGTSAFTLLNKLRLTRQNSLYERTRNLRILVCEVDKLTVLTLQLPAWELFILKKHFTVIRGRFGINNSLAVPLPAWLSALICSKSAVPRIQMEVFWNCSVYVLSPLYSVLPPYKHPSVYAPS